MVDGLDAIGEVLGRGQQLQAVVMVLIAHNVRFEGLQMAATLARLPAPALIPLKITAECRIDQVQGHLAAPLIPRP